MVGPQIEYNQNLSQLEIILESLDRPGDYFASGKVEGLMPNMSVSGVGRIAFPILDQQVRALIDTAEKAPYGRGPDTILDTSVRDCWQVDAGSVQISGAGWDETFRSIVENAAQGLGCTADSLDAELYKLLIYEPGGFFSEHRDTEKSDGMVATLIISLPTVGTGGELVIRHLDRTETIDLHVNEVGELPYAAFYADCVHLTQPVKSGHRIGLVYNLVMKPGTETETPTAPDYSHQADGITRILSEWTRSGQGPQKIVWLLEHEYSQVGLSQAAYKGLDEVVWRALAPAAERADCTLHSAILSIEESGIPDEDFYTDAYEYGQEVDYTGGSYSVQEVIDSSHTLRSWSGTDLTGSELPEIPLNDDEALPFGSLDDADPDEQTLLEASGNEGVSIERSYRRAAFVLWPRSREVCVIADGQLAAAVQYAERLLAKDLPNAEVPVAGDQLVAHLIDAWPKNGVGASYTTRAGEKSGGVFPAMFRLLTSVSDDRQSARFLREILVHRYNPNLNDSLVPFLIEGAPSSAAGFLPPFIRSNVRQRPGAVFALLTQIRNAQPASDERGWNQILQDAVQTTLQALPEAFAPPVPEGAPEWQRPTPMTLDSDAVRDLFIATHGLVPTSTIEGAVGLMGRHPELVDPFVTLPLALHELSRRLPAINGTQAYASLWQSAAGSLLQRSAVPPEKPRDQRIEAPFQCIGDHSRVLKDFCLDRRAKRQEFRAAQHIRTHLETIIKQNNLDIRYWTITRGRPYTLVCEKVPFSHHRRVEQHAADVEKMRLLTEASPSDGSAAVAQSLKRLHDALARAETGREGNP